MIGTTESDDLSHFFRESRPTVRFPQRLERACFRSKTPARRWDHQERDSRRDLSLGPAEPGHRILLVSTGFEDPFRRWAETLARGLLVKFSMRFPKIRSGWAVLNWFSSPRLRGHWWFCVLGLCFALHGVAQPARGLLREVYTGIPGSSVAELIAAPSFPNKPTTTNFVTDFFESPTDVLEEYGQRMRGYITPPVSGTYTFWIASDDGGELWLSTDATTANRRQIATVNAWTASREWGKEPNQQSAGIPLVAGRPYYIEALMKEGGGGDNLAVRWVRPDGVDQGPIPAEFLLPIGVAFRAPTITQQPANTSAVDGLVARFSVVGDPLGPASYQWRRNDVDLPGATGAELVYGPVTPEDNGARFTVRLSNDLGSLVSAEAILTVTPDITPPVLVRAYNLGPSTVRILFSEPMRVPAPGVFTLTGGVTVNSVAAGPGTNELDLVTSPLTYGTRYTLTVNGAQDRAATPNTISPNSTLSFTALELVPQDVGGPAVAGEVTRRTNGFDISAGGANLGGRGDEFHFAWEPRTGDFDRQVRVAGVAVSGAWLQAGLMARETLATNARFAGTFASSIQVGCFFESRATAGAVAVTASVPGGLPVNYPDQWLRLRRVGAVFTGFASFDGTNWYQLGTTTLAGAPATMFFGLATASASPSVTTTVQFREPGAVTGPSVVTYRPGNREPMGPFIRGTGLVLSEIMYHSRTNAAGRNLEFVELYNSSDVPEDLTGMRLTGDVKYSFPPGTRMQAGEFLVVPANLTEFSAAYPSVRALGPYTNSLNNAGGAVELRGAANQQLFEVKFGTRYPWPVAPDGGGHSLVLTRPSYGPSSYQSWSASARVGGSPGQAEPVTALPWDGLVINEWLAHTDDPQLDYIELYNHSNSELDLSGLVLTDDPNTNRFRIPAGTLIAPRGFAVFDQNQLGFRLSAAGESVFLLAPGGGRVIDAIHFDAQENGVSSGRVPDGAETQRRLAALTPGSANGTWRSEDIVISELMYNPITQDPDDEYVELYNRSTQPVNLADWRFTAGINYRFPATASLAPGAYLVVARNAARIRSNHPTLGASQVYGDSSGSLGNSGDHVVLAKPDDLLSTNAVGVVSSQRVHIAVSEVRYGVGGRWGRWADAGGSSLELIDLNADPLRPSNWADSDESQKAPWTEVGITNALSLGNETPTRLHFGLQGAGEALVDDVFVSRLNGTNVLVNPGFEAGKGSWRFFGTHEKSAIEAGAAFSESSGLRLRSSGDTDTGPNSVRQVLSPAMPTTGSGVIRARVRWVAGWPEILFRLKGNWLELAARMDVPRNLGTPGAPNSRRTENAGPAIYDVTHFPAVPKASEAVLITARASDPDGLRLLQVRFRLDPNTATLAPLTMRDDGAGGDAIAGDGIYTATLTGRAAGSTAAFRVEATDNGTTLATTTFPAAAVPEALIRWEDPPPNSSYATYNLWNTQAVETARNARTADGQSGGGLNNTYRDCTLIYNRSRVIYNAGFRDKGSPFHGGYGDLAVTVPPDDQLLGVTDRVLGLTGNGGEEGTQMAGQMANWVARQMGVPYLHSRYINVYRNGGRQGTISEDLEQPNGPYAQRWFVDDGDGELTKIAVWFEFADDNQNFNATGATLGAFRSAGQLRPARYRWNWQLRAQETANTFTNLFELVGAINASDFTPRMSQLINMDNWMRVFAFERVVGNWDSYTHSVGQNMYVYKQPGAPWRMMPWDLDFVMGLGDGATAALGGGGLGGGSQDGDVGNRYYDTPAFRRMLFRGLLDAANGPLMREQVAPEVAVRSQSLVNNGIAASNPNGIVTYATARRTFILNTLSRRDTNALAITTSGGADFSTAQPQVTLTGRAPFAAATLAVNGVPYPATWTEEKTFSLVVPLPQVVNVLTLTGLDRFGLPVPGIVDTITVTNTGAIPRVEEWVVLNEIQYNPAAANASFLEFHNRNTTVAFDLSGFRVEGVGYTFPAGAIIPANGYLVLAKDRMAFAAAYGNTVAVFGEFPGSLDNAGERVALFRPDGLGEALVTDTRYDNRLPWPVVADGSGPSLQLLDPARGSWRVGNWGTASTNDTVQSTPGKANSIRTSLEAFPGVWLNELMVNNPDGPTDNANQREPFVELYNRGSEPVDLSAYYLSDSYLSLTRWQFPSGTTLPPGGFLVVWADGQPEQSAGGVLHTPFRLGVTNAAVALSRLIGGVPEVLDFLEYRNSPRGRSYGSIPDGEPRDRRSFFRPTAGRPNDPVFPEIAVRINEFMAQNTSTITNRAAGKTDDWFELYNAGSVTVDLSGYYLTDSVTNQPTQFRIPTGYSIPAGGFLLVWADDKAVSNNVADPTLHVNFSLRREGEQLALLDPSENVVDFLSFGVQTNDVSVGRFPDGQPGLLTPFATATPGRPNFLPGGNLPPVLNPIGARSGPELSPLSFTATASDSNAGQTVTFSLESGAPAGATIHPTTGVFSWTPGEADGPGDFPVTVRATDNGSPARFARERVVLTITEVNQAPTLPNLAGLEVNEGDLATTTVLATDVDLPAQSLRYTLTGAVPAGAELDPVTGVFRWTPTEAQGGAIYVPTVRVTDDGSPAKFFERLLSITVNKVNNTPIVAAVPFQTVNETRLLTLTVSATDPDLPPQPLQLSLEGAPAGMVLNPTTGVITWTPTEGQGPGDYSILVRATEIGGGGLSSSRSFGVRVNELNTAPVLAVPADRTLVEGDLLQLVATATDADVPAQALSFALVSGPAGASIDPVSGQFRYQAPEDSVALDAAVTLRVTDNGPGNLSDERSFRLRIEPKFRVVINEIQTRPTVARAEFVELANPSAVNSWDLSGLRLTGTNLNFVFPPGTILAPRGFLCVVRDGAAFATAYGAAIPKVGPWTGELLAGADTLRLVRPGVGGGADTILGQVSYRASAPWPTTTPGKSLQLVDSTRDASRVANWSVSSAYNGPTNLIVMTNTWRYYVEGALDAGFVTNGYPDTAWPSGRALIYFEPDNLGAVENLKLTPLASRGPLTTYFRTRFNLASVPANAQLVIRTILDDGLVLYLNGARIYTENMETNAVIDANSLASITVPNAAPTGPFVIAENQLLAGENVLAAEVHQVNAGSSDVVFGLSLDLAATTAAGATPGAANNVTAPLEAFPSLWINEVLPDNSTGVTDAAGQREPWIELYNSGSEPVALDGWFLTANYSDPGAWAFPAGSSIGAGQFLLVFADGQPAQGTVTEPHTRFRLPGTTGQVGLARLKAGAPVIVDYADYSGLGPNVSLASQPDGQGIYRTAANPPTPRLSNLGNGANQPPVWGPLPDRTAAVGQGLNFVLAATDSDRPLQTLSYALLAPTRGATLGATSGVFSWTPTAADAGNPTFTVSVSDGVAAPVLGTFRVAVIHGDGGPTLRVRLATGGALEFTAAAPTGTRYRLEVSDSLTPLDWRSLVEATAVNEVVTLGDANPPNLAQRYYRIRSIP